VEKINEVGLWVLVEMGGRAALDSTNYEVLSISRPTSGVLLVLILSESMLLMPGDLHSP
jgi:hypothetical protein